MRIWFLFILFCLFSSVVVQSWAQTCSCSRPPLFSDVDTKDLKAKKWEASLSYYYNDLDGLVSGTETIKDDTFRKRSVQIAMVDIAYGVNDKLTLASRFSGVAHSRQVGSNPKQETDGLGDALFLVKSSFQSENLWTLKYGGGVKVPIGKDDSRTVGIASEDMQPGTGSWGAVAWVEVQIPKSWGVWHVNLNLQNHLENSREYQFGQETQVKLGLLRKFTEKIRMGAELETSKVEADQRFGSDLPNTGGIWLNFLPTLRVRLKDSINASLSAKIPIYRDLEGVRQFTSQYAISTSLSYSF